METWWIVGKPVIGLSLAIAPIILVLALRGYVYLSAQKFCYRDPTQVPGKPVAIVFGAGVWADGTPSPMLADRLSVSGATIPTKNSQQVTDEWRSVWALAIGDGMASTWHRLG